MGAWLTLVHACSPAGHVEKVRPRVGAIGRAPSLVEKQACAGVGSAPSREGFFHEVLFAEPTARTPRFDDYTRDSYHVHKLDLVRGLPIQAAACGVQLRAALVVGPMGPLWTYHVAALLQDGTNVRVNSLVMPHARITGKGTGLISNQDASVLLQQIENAPLVRPGLPTPPPEDGNSDFSYRVLLAVYDTGLAEYFHADFNEFSPDPGIQPLMDGLNALLATTKTQTYQHGDHVH